MSSAHRLSGRTQPMTPGHRLLGRSVIRCALIGCWGALTVGHTVRSYNSPFFLSLRSVAARKAHRAPHKPMTYHLQHALHACDRLGDVVTFPLLLTCGHTGLAGGHGLGRGRIIATCCYYYYCLRLISLTLLSTRLCAPYDRRSEGGD